MNDSSLPKFSVVEEGRTNDRRKTVRSLLPKSEVASYWIIAKRYKWTILGMVLLGALLGFLKANSETPIYQSSLTLLIEPTRPKSGSIEEIISSYTNPYRFYQTQAEIIRSRAIAERIAAKLDPDDFAWLESQPKPGYWSEMSTRLVELIGRAPESNVETETVVDTETRLAGLVMGKIIVDGGDRSQVVKLRYESPDPEFSAAVVNAAADAYIELSLDTRLAQIKIANGWLNEQIEELRRKVSESEASLQAYQSQESLVDTGKLAELANSRLSALNSEVTVAQVKVTSLEKRYGNKHPAMKAARAELAEVMERLKNEKDNVVQSQSQGFQLAKLEREVATNQRLYDQFLTRFKETGLAMQYDVNDVRIIDRANTPGAPIRPVKRNIIITWTLLGLVLGVMLVWLRDTLDNTYKSANDVEHELSLPVLGIVPYLDNATRRRSRFGKETLPERFYIHNLKSGFAESVNNIRTSILYTDVDNPPKVIMITSALQGEGKTTLSSNLALAFSQLGKTLLLDADLRKPRLSGIAGLAPLGGLTDIVAGQADITDGLKQDSESEDLYVLSCGVLPPNPLELISSEKFAHLIDELKTRFAYIVIDSPPVLPVSDAIVLGNLADVTILAIRGEKTHRSAPVSALNNLYNAEVNVIGIGLTQVALRKANRSYDNNYGYYGGYYGRQEGTGQG